MDFFAHMTERDYEQQFLEDIAALHDGERRPTPDQTRPVVPEGRGDLVFAAGYSDVGIGISTPHSHVTTVT